MLMYYLIFVGFIFYAVLLYFLNYIITNSHYVILIFNVILICSTHVNIS
jgi:hypothetical protein